MERLGAGLIAERFVVFDRELSVLAVAGRDGGARLLSSDRESSPGGHPEGELCPGAGPRRRPSNQTAQRLAALVLHRLDYVGVLAIELFEVGGRLLANEMAPRVHNSGHWTLDGADASQFENHIRAVTGMPLATPRVAGPTAMVNIIGELPDPGALAAIPGARLHLYDKAPRPVRKIGHINATGRDEAAVMRTVARGVGTPPRGRGAPLRDRLVATARQAQLRARLHLPSVPVHH